LIPRIDYFPRHDLKELNKSSQFGISHFTIIHKLETPKADVSAKLLNLQERSSGLVIAS
jgi:hypothetical protein